MRGGGGASGVSFGPNVLILNGKTYLHQEDDKNPAAVQQAPIPSI
jgi:hypothetical protein